MSQASFLSVVQQISDGYENVEDEPRSGAPKIYCTEENVLSVEILVMKDSRIYVRTISEAVGVSIGTAGKKIWPKIWSSTKSVPSLFQRFCQMIIDNFEWTFVTIWMAERGHKIGTALPLQPRPCPSWHFVLPTHERKSQGHHISVNWRAERGIGNLYLKGLLDKVFEGGLPGLEEAYTEVHRCKRALFWRWQRFVNFWQ